MFRRTKRHQKKHDECVLRSAKWHAWNGYAVTADLPGYPRPKTIYGYIPDMIARKRGREVILEVETHLSLYKDSDQHRAFRLYANRKKHRQFRIKLV
ncbi:MAG: hypothetical protein COU90_01420 [Candidatus Ryanbacteria bacterium CG10_big_fil_rev_8_21_14_0_10_43_42]|uniref:Uncharacterized protein n=1 Tax=Candidatus Ryanbacteria bacterium CG10_big_fil_rev_8_21_14_0_10_43_42 TaxID=1974864 RepID=A0A2M8KXN6_9BACT|nr:MAG: hypothetical protein COU90_01420 [Candidatus Ryanbacteria bacterium CG10_big_fil_rev_8_21_14_0_10_43_42]